MKANSIFSYYIDSYIIIYLSSLIVISLVYTIFLYYYPIYLYFNISYYQVLFFVTLHKSKKENADNHHELYYQRYTKKVLFLPKFCNYCLNVYPS
jgi:hypothetical protein